MELEPGLCPPMVPEGVRAARQVLGSFGSAVRAELARQQEQKKEKNREQALSADQPRRP